MSKQTQRSSFLYRDICSSAGDLKNGGLQFDEISDFLVQTVETIFIKN